MLSTFYATILESKIFWLETAFIIFASKVCNEMYLLLEKSLIIGRQISNWDYGVVQKPLDHEKTYPNSILLEVTECKQVSLTWLTLQKITPSK